MALLCGSPSTFAVNASRSGRPNARGYKRCTVNEGGKTVAHTPSSRPTPTARAPCPPCQVCTKLCGQLGPDLMRNLRDTINDYGHARVPQYLATHHTRQRPTHCAAHGIGHQPVQPSRQVRLSVTHHNLSTRACSTATPQTSQSRLARTGPPGHQERTTDRREVLQPKR